MNSSIKPPLQNLKKFRFETDFDLEEERLRVDLLREEEEHHQEPEPEEVYVPPAPTFSEDEMHYARDEAFKDGFAKGAEEARQGLERDVLATVTQIVEHVERLMQQHAAQKHDMQVLAMRSATAVIKKVWPQIVQYIGLETVEETLRQTLDANPDETRIVLRVHENMLQPIQEIVPKIQEQKAFGGKIMVMADADLHLGDCKIEWADGGMERLSNDLFARLENAMEHLLALIPKADSTSHAKADLKPELNQELNPELNVDTERTSL